MESETVLGDITNVITKNGERTINHLDQRVALIRINPVKASFLNFHEEWSNGNTHIDPSCVICLEGNCGDILEQIDKNLWYVCWTLSSQKHWFHSLYRAVVVKW